MQVRGYSGGVYTLVIHSGESRARVPEHLNTCIPHREPFLPSRQL